MAPQVKHSHIRILADKIRKSDHGAFRELFELLWDSTYTFAQSLLQDHQTAQDITQEIWIDYWERRETIKNKNIKAYLLQAVKYRVYKHFRDEGFKTIHLEVIREMTIPSNVRLKHNLNHTKKHLEGSINELSPRCKEIFLLSRFSKLSSHQIAEQLNINKRTVENQLSIALKKINEDLRRACMGFL